MSQQKLQAAQPEPQRSIFYRRRISIAVYSTSLILYLLYRNVDEFAWFVSAIGRMGMISILPYWNWEGLEDAECLVEKPNWLRGESPNEDDELLEDVYELGKYETEPENCMLCEALEKIPTTTNIDRFRPLRQMHLEQGHPVLVTNSSLTFSPKDFLVNVKKGQNFLDSEPCEAVTNLFMRKFFTVRGLVTKVEASQANSSWFFHLRNCDFPAVKDSRYFVKKATFHPVHLPPFYSSWLLMSQNTPKLRKEIYLRGLVIVQQIHGELVVALAPKNPCGETCRKHEVLLKPGDSFVFLTDLWIFEYLVEGVGMSITTVMEIVWEV